MRTYPKYGRNAHESQPSPFASVLETIRPHVLRDELVDLSLGGFGLDQTP